MERIDRRRIGEILLSDNLISKEQLDEAVEFQKKMEEKKPLGELLVELGYLSEEGLCLSLSKKLGLRYVSLSDSTLLINLDQGLDRLITEEFARLHMLVPVSKTARRLTIAMWDPLDFVVIDNVKKLTRMELDICCTTRKDIASAIDRLYGKKEEISEKATETKEIPVEIGGEFGVKRDELDKLKLKAAEAPIVRVVNNMIQDAVKERASDVHIEQQEEDVSIRYRVDGVLYLKEKLLKEMAPAVISRIKILSRLDIAEKRIPQDGGFMMKFKHKTIDVRVSSIPTIYGEKLALRLLDKEAMTFKLSDLEMSAEDHKKVSQNINKPNGLVILTGPTGSGKTTTLYCILNELRSTAKNILTIEDPVEYRIDGVNQVQAMPQIGLDFARGLRAFLRQDPDIIMVGEVRDLETAEICVRSALVGRLVLSTLHTNDSVGTISRLLDFGVEPFLLSSTLNMVIAQRLVRRLCPKCRKPAELDAKTQERYSLKGTKVFRAGQEKCAHCAGHGYLGRIAVFEIMCIDSDLRVMIEKRSDIESIRKTVLEKGMTTLREDGLDKVRRGITSLDEVLAATMGTA